MVPVDSVSTAARAVTSVVGLGKELVGYLISTVSVDSALVTVPLAGSAVDLLKESVDWQISLVMVEKVMAAAASVGSAVAVMADLELDTKSLVEASSSSRKHSAMASTAAEARQSSDHLAHKIHCHTASPRNTASRPPTRPP